MSYPISDGDRGIGPTSRGTSPEIRPQDIGDTEVVNYEVPIQGTINVYDFRSMRIHLTKGGDEIVPILSDSIERQNAIKKSILCELNINLDLVVRTIDFSKLYKSKSKVVGNILNARKMMTIKASKSVPYYFSTGISAWDRFVSSEKSYKQYIDLFVYIYESDVQMADSESMGIEANLGIEDAVKAGITLSGTFSKGRTYSMPGAAIDGIIRLELNTIGIGMAKQISSLQMVKASFTPAAMQFRQNFTVPSPGDFTGAVLPFVTPVEPRFSRGKDDGKSKASLNDLLINGDTLSYYHNNPPQIIMSKSKRLLLL